MQIQGTTHSLMDFGYGQHHPADILHYVGRYITFYQRTYVVVDAIETDRTVYRGLSTELPMPNPDLIIVSTEDYDEHGPVMQTVGAAGIAEAHKTIIHWSYPAPDEEKASLREVVDLRDAGERAKVRRDLVHQRKIDEQKARELEAVELWAKHCPEWAKAVIVAEYEEDESDSMSDYFHARTTKTVILAWSKHTRNLFPEMRKAARNYKETAHLADGPKEWERRENYRGGGGYYLKDGYRHSNGWKIKKVPFYGGTRPSFVADFSVVAKGAK